MTSGEKNAITLRVIRIEMKPKKQEGGYKVNCKNKNQWLIAASEVHETSGSLGEGTPQKHKEKQHKTKQIRKIPQEPNPSVHGD